MPKHAKGREGGREQEGDRERESNVTLYAAPNPFLCTLYLNKICLNQYTSTCKSQNWSPQ